jgi:hypothetical protein
MSSHSLQPGDALLSAIQKPAVVVQVDELSVESPTAEATEVLSRRVEVGKTATIAHQDNLELFSVPVARSRTSEVAQDTSLAMSASSVQRSSSHEVLWCPNEEKDGDANTPSRRRALRMQLPSFRSLGIAFSDSEYFGRRPPPPAERHSGPSTRPPLQAGRAAAQSLPLPNSESSRPFPLNLGNTPLLTPPEDADSIKWNNALLHTPAHPNGGQSSSTAHSTTIVMASKSSEDQQAHRVPASSSQSQDEHGIPSQQGSNERAERLPHQDDQGSALARAIRPFSEYCPSDRVMPTLIHPVSRVVSAEAPIDNIRIIAQVLPQPAIDSSNAKAAFEEVVDAIQSQRNSDDVAYITLTHAVPPKFEMKDLPTSPPATPNITQGRDDYFGQTIFTNAATVSTYHGHKSLLNSQAPPSPNTIVAPSSIHLSVLERYIPPTSSFEYADFFDSRSHSILVDRLAELSVRSGRLLLLYPTKSGAETFMSAYLNPILDPFLREFIFLNNLFFQLGTTLGTMSAVGSMLDFENMEAKVQSLCRALSRKVSLRGGPSSVFSLVHSSKGASTVDGKTWKEWFVNQEMARIKENLFEYAKSGGRMPPELNHHQLTPSVLARHVVDGIQDSSRVSVGVPIELGMFVIERSRN